MELVCPRVRLSAALQAVLRATAARPGIPALSGALLELDDGSLRVTATDLELTIESRLAVAGTAGATLVPARLLADVVRAVPGDEVRLTADGGMARLGAGDAAFALRVLPAEDLPLPPPLDATEGVTLDAGAFRHAAARVVRCAARDETRPVLASVLIELEPGEMRLVATDDYRLAVDTVAADVRNPARLLVSARAVQEVSRLAGDGPLVLRWGAGQAAFAVGDTTVRCRVVDGVFPDYTRLLAAGPAHRLEADRTSLLDAVRAVSMLARDGDPLELSVGPGSVVVSCRAAQVGEGRLAVRAVYDGPAMQVRFNPSYLADGIESVDGETVVLELTGESSRALVRGDGRFVYVVNPIRRG